MSTTLTQILIAVLGADALFKFIEWIIERRDKKKTSPEKQALLALCSERCESLLHKWLKSDAEDRSAARWTAIKNLYNAYRALGGNGEVETLYLLACEIKPKE